MKKIKLSEARNRTVLADRGTMRKTKGGVDLSSACLRAFDAACGGPGCSPGRILADLRAAGIC